jgi:Fe-S cluster assembly protein SufD
VTPMTAQIRHLKTSAELALVDAFATAKGRSAGAETAAAFALRDAAFERFLANGLPHRRIEDWRYTDLRALMRDAKPLATPPDADTTGRAMGAGRIIAGVDCRRLVVVNGVFSPELSDLGEIERGLTIRSMAAALADGDPLVTLHLAKVVPTDDAVVALNTALMGDGVVIRVARGANIARPLHVAFITIGELPTSAFTRSLVVVERGARVALVESHEGEAGSDYQVNTALDLAIGDDAEVDHLRIVAEGAEALHVATLMAALGARAHFQDVSFVTGGAAIRNQLLLRFEGAGAIANVRGASLLKGRQHSDILVIADHQESHCQSHELFKAVVDDDARSIFQGRISVRPGAQKTDARMMTRALLLSNAAEAVSKPELEIFADDVQCGHGATTGSIDSELKFYLMARGIPGREAETLLVQAFIGEVIDGIAHAGLREALTRASTAWLAARR